MPASTRSATRQPKLEEVNGTESKDNSASESRKRKASATRDPEPKKRKASDSKKSAQVGKQSKQKEENVEQGDEAIITINRAPVLELWSSCVAHFLYPDVSWDTCLSVGSAIATITAVAKGRSIGTMEKPDQGEAADRQRRRLQAAQNEYLGEIEVMHFKLRLKDGEAMVGDKPKKGNEAALRKKFGNEAYERVKGTFEEMLELWQGNEEELDGKAFHMYETFRPDVPKGQKGWGRKGQLNLQSLRSAVEPG